MSKIVTVDSGNNQKKIESYFPRLIPPSCLTPSEVTETLPELEKFEKIKEASIYTCLMI